MSSLLGETMHQCSQDSHRHTCASVRALDRFIKHRHQSPPTLKIQRNPTSFQLAIARRRRSCPPTKSSIGPPTITGVSSLSPRDAKSAILKRKKETPSPLRTEHLVEHLLRDYRHRLHLVERSRQLGAQIGEHLTRETALPRTRGVVRSARGQQASTLNPFPRAPLVHARTLSQRGKSHRARLDVRRRLFITRRKKGHIAWRLQATPQTRVFKRSPRVRVAKTFY